MSVTQRSYHMSLLFYYSDLRARLEVAVDKIMTLAKYQDAEKDKDTSDDYNSDSEEVFYFL